MKTLKQQIKKEKKQLLFNEIFIIASFIGIIIFSLIFGN